MSESVKKISKTALMIQNAATELFASHGYDGTIMDELASITGANKASIYYHFQNKKHLYEVCMTDLMTGVANEVVSLVEQQNSVLDKLKTFVVQFSKAAYQNRQIPSVLMREVASGGVNMPVPARQQMQRLVFCLKQILEEGVSLGQFTQVNPITLHMMIVGSLCFYICSEPLRLAIESEQQTDPSLENMTAELVQMVHSSLLKSS